MVIALSIPIGHWSPFLKASLASLKAQEDNLEIALMVASEDPRIRDDIAESGLKFAYSRFGPDAGQSGAIAEGWKNTKAPILAWLNGDDALTRLATSRVLKAFNKTPELDVFYGESTISLNNGKIVGLHPAVTQIDDLIYRTNTISQPSCFVKRSAVEDIGGLDDGRHYTMDWDLWIRLYRAKKHFGFTSDILSNVTWEIGTKTSSLNLKRLKEIYGTLKETQTFVKTALGLYSVLRDNSSAYVSEGTLSASTKPFYQDTLELINMQPETMYFLSLTHNLGKEADIETKQASDRQILNAENTQFHFNNGMMTGQCTSINLEKSRKRDGYGLYAEWTKP